MRVGVAGLWLGAMLASGCAPGNTSPRTTAAAAGRSAAIQSPVSSFGTQALPGATAGGYRGFDRNVYPGDEVMAGMHATFAFTGYWLTNPPGESSNSWMGKRAVLRQQGWGFLVLANGRLDAEILQAKRRGVQPAELGRKDAAVAVAAARSEGFPAHTVLFLDQEEGGLLLEEQAAYLLGWTEAVSGGDYRAGVYASGQPVPNGPGHTITTVEDIRARVKAGKLHEVAMFDAQDTCPPSPGCTLHARPLSQSGELDLTAWQYSQSPRRPKLTKACAATYAADGNCYAPGFPQTFLDMDLARSADPSDGR